jgi:hypothetical protein
VGDTEPHHRLDAVTVRIGIPPDEIAQAERVLGLDPQTARQTWLQLYETPADGRSRALASSGVSLGLCALDPGVRVAVRVHHARRLPLDGKWAGFRSADGERLRVEEERDGARRVITATLSAPWPGRMLPTEERVPLTDLLSVRQAAFLTPDLAVPWLENRAVYKMRV